MRNNADFPWERYEEEIRFQADLVELGWRELQDAVGAGGSLRDEDPRPWHAIQSILTAAACISRHLWPSKSSQTRARGLRDRLRIVDSNPLKNREIRNYFEHFDERLDRCVGVPVHQARTIAPPGQPMARVTEVRAKVKVPASHGPPSNVKTVTSDVPLLGHFCAARFEVTYEKSTVSLKDVVDAVREVRKTIRAARAHDPWPEGFFDSTYGCFRNDAIARQPQPAFEPREPLT